MLTTIYSGITELVRKWTGLMIAAPLSKQAHTDAVRIYANAALFAARALYLQVGKNAQSSRATLLMHITRK